MMRLYQTIFLMILIFCAFNIASSAQNNSANNFGDLIVSRKGVEKHYKANTRLLLSYETDSSLQKIKGIFLGIVDGKAVIIRKKKSIDKTLIPVENIVALKKIKPGRRIVYSVIGTTLVGTGAAVIGNEGSSPTSAMKSALIIPVVAVGAYLLYAVPASLLFEKINEKKRHNGWKFGY